MFSPRSRLCRWGAGPKLLKVIKGSDMQRHLFPVLITIKNFESLLISNRVVCMVPVINTSEAGRWGDLKGILGFSVSELMDKCPYMVGLFSPAMC